MIDAVTMLSRDRSLKEINDTYALLLSVNPVYDWLSENIEKINFKLIKGFITNIVPLGKAGERYFNNLVRNRFVITEELMNQYYRLERKYSKGELKINSYFQMIHFGYTGVVMNGKCPVDSITQLV